jgi:hypothetical protein
MHTYSYAYRDTRITHLAPFLQRDRVPTVIHQGYASGYAGTPEWKRVPLGVPCGYPVGYAGLGSLRPAHMNPRVIPSDYA